MAHFHTVQISRNDIAEEKDNDRRLTVVLRIVLVTGKPPIHRFLDRLGRVVQGSVMWRIY